MRKCRICGQYKDDELFVKDKYVKGGIKNVCYECNKEDAKARRKKLSNIIAENEILQKKLEIAVGAINSAANYLVCMDDLSELNDGKCNEQMALETLNKALEELKK